MVAAAAAGNFVPRSFVFEDFDNVDGGVLVDRHFIDTVAVVDVGVVEPGTVTGFPFGSAEHAELGCATASHVVATLFQLNHCFAVIASLPALLLRHLYYLLRLFILGAVFPDVPDPIAQYTHLRSTPPAFCILPSDRKVHANA